MKIRLDFVTNSSSSSFICNVCGDVQSGWEMDLSEAEMVECENGHVFCEHHINGFDCLTTGAKKEIIIAVLEKSKDDPVLLKRIKIAAEDMDYDELFEELECRCNIPAKFCPICSFEVLTDRDALYYLLKKQGLILEELHKEIKETFASYNDFENFLK